MTGVLDALGVGVIAMLVIRWLLRHTSRLTDVVANHIHESTQVQTRLADATEHLIVVIERLEERTNLHQNKPPS